MQLDLDTGWLPFSYLQILARRFYAWDPWVQLGRDVSHWASLPDNAFMAFLSLSSPDLVMKITLVSCLAISGVSMYYLTANLANCKRIPSLVSALVYMYNPWIIDRIIWGHLSLVLGYSIMPLFIALSTKSILYMSKMTALKAGIVLAFLISIDFRIAYLALIATAVLSVIPVAIDSKSLFKSTYRLLNAKMIVAKVESIAILLVVAVILNIFWLLPGIIFGFQYKGAESIFLTMNVFTLSDLNHYSSMGTIANAIRMRTNVFSYFHLRGDQPGLEAPIMGDPYFYTLSTVMFVIPFLAIILRPRDKIVTSMTVIVLVSIFLTLGTQGPLRIYLSLYQYFPFFNMFREPNKFVALLALSYAYLIGVTTSQVSKLISNGR